MYMYLNLMVCWATCNKLSESLHLQPWEELIIIPYPQQALNTLICIENAKAFSRSWLSLKYKLHFQWEEAGILLICHMVVTSSIPNDRTSEYYDLSSSVFFLSLSS